VYIFFADVFSPAYPRKEELKQTATQSAEFNVYWEVWKDGHQEDRGTLSSKQIAADESPDLQTELTGLQCRRGVTCTVKVRIANFPPELLSFKPTLKIMGDSYLSKSIGVGRGFVSIFSYVLLLLTAGLTLPIFYWWLKSPVSKWWLDQARPSTSKAKKRG
jgi:hypothetical protein